MDTSKAEKQVIDEVEAKIEALNFIDSFKDKMGDISTWRPMGDCPFFGKIKTSLITECYLERLKHKNHQCCIINPSVFCIKQKENKTWYYKR